MRFLPPDEQEIVSRAQAIGLDGATPAPAYLCPRWCTALSLWLTLPTFGYSLIIVPLLWVIQHDRTANRLARLRLELEERAEREIACQDSVSAPKEPPTATSGKDPSHPGGIAEKILQIARKPFRCEGDTP
ncbi:MAG: hypothetical protein VKN83_00810 [Cyanobacteriota bacterium]|nr:hypothetical protein [Cyanobacteriota bacterium]